MTNLWDMILPAVETADVNRFRVAGGVNSRFAHWEPSEVSLRWFKSYLLMAAMTQSKQQREILSKIQNTHVGVPVTVDAGGGPLTTIISSRQKRFRF